MTMEKYDNLVTVTAVFFGVKEKIVVRMVCGREQGKRGGVVVFIFCLDYNIFMIYY